MIADHETALIGQITDRIIDADRLVREQHGEVFPSFAMYRLILCGDRLHLSSFRQWWVNFSLQWVADNYRKEFDDETVCVAAWDALARVMQQCEGEEFVEVYNEFLDRTEKVQIRRDPIMTDEYASESLGVRRSTYTLLRKSLQLILARQLDMYWLDLLAAYAKVIADERREMYKLR